MEQILLYRDTRESILNGTDAEAWRHMLPAAREKALLAEMKAESNLHPALYPPSEDGSAILGHYKVLYATWNDPLLSSSRLLMMWVGDFPWDYCLFRPQKVTNSYHQVSCRDIRFACLVVLEHQTS